jgi:tetraacyldisaccharide 4'-kinase
MMSWLQQLPQYWQSTSAVTVVLWPLELAYRLALFVRKQLYAFGIFKSHRVNATVIVVGNVVAGGGGKTPLTVAIVQRLTQQGFKVGVVTRGYGRKQSKLHVVSANSSPREAGDEPLLIHQKCDVPVVVSSNRVEAAQRLLQKFPDTQILVCDDGLQHWALARDLEICVMDAQGIGNGHLLPAGPLREPWPRATHLLLHTQKRTLAEGYESNRRLSPVAISNSGVQTPLSELKLNPVEVVSGIAKPIAFIQMLQELGMQIQHQTALPDHDDFSTWHAKHPECPLLCTEKDAIKLWQTHPHALAVPLIFEPEDAFWQAFDALVQSSPRYH